MTAASGKDLSKALESKGWELLRIQCSHHIYGKQGSVVRLLVPVHGNQPLKAGLLNHLMKLAGISDEDL